MSQTKNLSIHDMADLMALDQEEYEFEDLKNSIKGAADELDDTAKELIETMTVFANELKDKSHNEIKETLAELLDKLQGFPEKLY